MLVEAIGSKYIVTYTNDMARTTGKNFSTHQDFLAKLLALEDGGKIDRHNLFTTLCANIAAGSDTTAISLSAVFYCLLQNPTKLGLRKEIDQHVEEGKISNPVTFSEAQNMPYLQAVIKEALRLHPASGQLLAREIPIEGTTLAGYFFPQGTTAGMSPWVYHMDSTVFGDQPNEFKPERWLGDLRQTAIMDTNLLSFGAGARTCIGRNISMLGMVKVVPQILRQFDLELQDPTSEWEIDSDEPVELSTEKTNIDQTPLRTISWDGPDDTHNPKNWTDRAKWTATHLVSGFGCMPPVTGTIVAPAIDFIATDLEIGSSVMSALCLSIFLIGVGLAPLILTPLSGIHGRLPILHFTNIFFLIFNTACCFSQSQGQLLAFRFLSGVGASAGLSVGGGVIGDLWKAERRARAAAVYTLGPLIGPAIGPIMGGFVSDKASWRWAFWAISIAAALVQVSAALFLRETYGPAVLARKVRRLQKETQQLECNLCTEVDDKGKDPIKHVLESLLRPFRLMGTQVIVQFLAIYMGLLYGVMWLLLFNFPLMWTEQYNESASIGGLNYISVGLGFVFGSQTNGFLNDFFYKKLKTRNGDKGKPEFRIPLMVPGSMMVPIGLFWFGWSGEAQIHWIMPNIGAFLFCAGCIFCYQSIQTYTIDAYTKYAASAISTLNFTRSITSFTFPLFAPYLFDSLGFGWENSLLAFLSLGFGIVVPATLWKYGQRLREKSPFATGD
ncbi:hypothetical protein MMC10_007580 [Thelotrema lepadinum]|nr:hypothetical protein [Thelotrema lepadinum]